MTPGTEPVAEAKDDPPNWFNDRLEVRDIAEFRVWEDGDLEVELTSRRWKDNGWTGTYLTRAEAIQLRDYLVRKYP